MIACKGRTKRKTRREILTRLGGVNYGVDKIVQDRAAATGTELVSGGVTSSVLAGIA